MKNLLINSILLSGILCLTGCSETFLDLEPLDQQTEAIYFNKPSDFVAAANNLHSNIYAWSGSTTYDILTDAGSDLVCASNGVGSGTNTVGASAGYWS